MRPLFRLEKTEIQAIMKRSDWPFLELYHLYLIILNFKKMKKFLIIAFLTFMISSCEDVINVDLNTAEPRLVIDASIKWVKGTTGANQSIKLTLTAPYFDAEIPPATGAEINITDSNNN